MKGEDWTLSDAEGEETLSNLASISDLMSALLFLFMLTLMVFALNFEITTTALTGAAQARTTLLAELERTLAARGVPVEVDAERGVLRLPENLLFSSGKADLDAGGERTVAAVAEALAGVLPCYTGAVESRPKGCDPAHQFGRLDAVFIEGHTDNVPFRRAGGFRDNWDLSVNRALAVFHRLLSTAPALDGLRNGEGQAVLSVSGYAERRPVVVTPDATAEPRNRRIDLRFVMEMPRDPRLRAEGRP